MVNKLFSAFKSFLRPSVTKTPDNWHCFRIVDGKIAPPYSFEINVVDHCNRRCTDCDHAAPAMAPKFADPDVVFRDLLLLSKSYKAQALKIIGGEPLLHPDLLSVIRAGRKSGICNHIFLVTNGMLLHQMSSDLWDALDEVELSVYPETRKMLEEHMPVIQQKAEKHRVKLTRILYENFRIPFSLVGTSDLSLIRCIYRTCLRARIWGCHSIYEGYFFKCAQCIYVPRIIDQSVTYDYRKDGIRITGDSNFQDTLKNYLSSKEPLNACRYCLGGIGKLRANATMQVSEWTSTHYVPTEQLADYNKLNLLEKGETIYDADKIRL